MNIEFINEPIYTFGSTDNLRSYLIEWQAGNGKPVSTHGIVVDGKPFTVIGAYGGATGVHENSMTRVGNAAYFAFGDQIVSFDLIQKTMRWNLCIDSATCFGVYYSKAHGALISHGELLISRFTPEGSILWQSGGRDFFTGEFNLLEDCIQAVDFEGREYRLDYKNVNEIHC